MTVDTQTRPSNRSALTLLVPFAIGAAVSVALGVYGRVHTATLIAMNLPFFTSALNMKVWLASAGFFFALVQLASALAMYGMLPGGASVPGWVSPLHRWSGRIAFLLVVPVAMMCLYALGFEHSSPRVLIHSLLGCFFFGAFVAKMLLLSRRGTPGWVLPVMGGLVFTALVGLWLTSSLWYFTTVGVRF